ncbi:universal stress protein [Aeromicrobium fastidiosum]|uniref:universal stress protein n=1 Tax=Aeromicrobium TaxID=2040 RepID=UPI00177BD659|nr:MULTISPECIES: universal stress protein [Aeromicrobium]MBD8606395.1 universal stress protein [Aeromicrobium sp. CFBP 8757]MCL8250475.1 universal stress protein [Aeromicrobium fastidiosum]
MSTRPRPVVVAIADKQPSAVAFAADEARSTGAGLRVVHAVGTGAQSAEFYLGAERAMLDREVAAGREVLADARRVLDQTHPGLDTEFVLTEQAPIDALDREARGARLVVVGADDVPWYERILRTRVAGRLAMRAPCPVVVVPELEFPTGPDGEVVVALDGETSAAGPLRLAFEEAGARDCLLHVLHATPPGTLASDAEAARADVSAAVATWRTRRPDVMVLEGAVHDNPAAAVARATRAAELVVVGRPHHTLRLGVSRPLASRVLAVAQCPVAVVPADYDGR